MCGLLNSVGEDGAKRRTFLSSSLSKQPDGVQNNVWLNIKGGLVRQLLAEHIFNVQRFSKELLNILQFHKSWGQATHAGQSDALPFALKNNFFSIQIKKKVPSMYYRF